MVDVLGVQVSWIYLGTYVFQIKKGSLFNSLRRVRRSKS